MISAPSIFRMSAASASGYRYENASMSTRLAWRLKNSVSDLMAYSIAVAVRSEMLASTARRCSVRIVRRRSIVRRGCP